MKTAITTSEWHAELDRLAHDKPITGGGLSIEDLVPHLGISRNSVRRMLKLAKAAGRLKCGRELREALDGRMMPTPVYWIKKA